MGDPRVFGEDTLDNGADAVSITGDRDGGRVVHFVPRRTGEEVLQCHRDATTLLKRDEKLSCWEALDRGDI